jgi:hypothetical protein
MQGMPRLKFPEGSLLAAILGEHAPMDVRRAVRRLSAEGAPALAVDDEIAGLAHGLAVADVSHSPAVLDVLPPLFWLEAPSDARTGARGIRGWIVEKKRGGLAIRGFSVALGPEAEPEPAETATLSFDATVPEQEDEVTLYVRGLVAAVSLPGMLSQMGESSPVMLIPADASDQDASVLRGYRLFVAVSPTSAPT